MKYQSGSYLYYVNPFVFTIEVVRVEFYDEQPSMNCYIESNGAYLDEKDLFYNLQDAKCRALNLLRLFNEKKLVELNDFQGELNEENIEQDY